MVVSHLLGCVSSGGRLLCGVEFGESECGHINGGAEDSHEAPREEQEFFRRLLRTSEYSAAYCTHQRP